MAKINITKPQNNLTITALDGSKKIISTTPIGIQGSRGDTGATGVSISGASLSNYNLILTFSNGSTVNVGYVRGETGAGGSGGSGGSLQTLVPSPAGYYPYASIFIDQYGRVTGASGATDIASQSTLNAALALILNIQSTFTGGVQGGTWSWPS